MLCPEPQVDPASDLQGHILNRDGVVFDVMLSLVDLSKNADKYYLLQVRAIVREPQTGQRIGQGAPPPSSKRPHSLPLIHPSPALEGGAGTSAIDPPLITSPGEEVGGDSRPPGLL